MTKLLFVIIASLFLSAGSALALTSNSSVIVTGDETTISQETSVVNSDEAMAIRRQRQIDGENNIRPRVAPDSMESDQPVQNDAAQAERKDQLCNLVQTRLQAHADRYERNGATYMLRVRHLEEILTTVIARFENTDVEVTALSNMLQQLNADADAFETKMQAHLADLEKIEQAACSGAEADYRQMMTTNRANFISLKADAESIKNYIETTIKPELQDLKLQTEAARENDQSDIAD